MSIWSSKSFCALAAFIVTAVLFASGCSATESSTTPSSRAAEGVQQAYGDVLQAVDQFEGGAESAAQDGGPIGLADFAIANGNLILGAATALNDSLAKDPSAGGFPEPELIQRAAAAVTIYGRSLSSLGSQLAACPRGDTICYDAAYDAESAGSAAREEFRNTVRSIQSAVQ